MFNLFILLTQIEDFRRDDTRRRSPCDCIYIIRWLFHEKISTRFNERSLDTIPQQSKDSSATNTRSRSVNPIDGRRSNSPVEQRRYLSINLQILSISKSKKQ